ncbi:MAG: PIN domain-containing protein [Dokdonella sp.]|uniref:PIN domain-containing protein n=1 Tax=Dokdonella sp. TaxID=2291710 RepID=UPI003262F1DC
MDRHYFLIDFENVQIQNLGSLTPGSCHIKIFLGQNQSKLPLELVKALRPFGQDADYIQITGNGSNALDFHVAFYMGRLAAEHADAAFTIISKDTGFDPLVKHVNGLQIRCKRLDALPGSASIAIKVPVKAPAVKKPGPVSVKATRGANVAVAFEPVADKEPSAPKMPAASARVAEVIKRLKGMNKAKPAKLATLQSSIKSWFKPGLDQKATASIIQSLTDQKKITVSGTKVGYSL